MEGVQDIKNVLQSAMKPQKKLVAKEVGIQVRRARIGMERKKDERMDQQQTQKSTSQERSSTLGSN